MIHVAERVKRGHRRVAIKTVDTDVVALSVTAELRTQLCVAFGSGN